MLTLHDKLEAEGPRTAPDPETAEERIARRRRSRVELVALFAAVAGTLLGLDEFGIVELPRELVLGALALMTLAAFADWFRPEDEDDDG
jgi:hypothetical protein